MTEHFDSSPVILTRVMKYYSDTNVSIYLKQMDKRRILVDLLKRYLNGDVDTTSFCDDFNTLYFYESNARELFCGAEREQMDEIADVVSYYSPYKEDLAISGSPFKDAKTVKATVLEKREFLESLGE